MKQDAAQEPSPEADRDAAFQQLLATLEIMLNDQAPAGLVRAKLREADGLGRPFPPGLRERTSAYIRREELVAARGRQLRKIVIAAALLMPLAALAYFLWSASRSARPEAPSPVPSQAPAPDTRKKADTAPTVEAHAPPAPTVDVPPSAKSWADEWPRIRALLPDLEKYDQALAAQRNAFPERAEVRDRGRWANSLAAYRHALACSNQIRALLAQTPGAPIQSPEKSYRAFQHILLQEGSPFDGPGPYAETLARYKARADYYVNGSARLTAFKEQLTKDLMVKLRAFDFDDPKIIGKKMYYTLDSETFKPAQGGQVAIPVFKDTSLRAALMLMPANRHSPLRVPGHVTLAQTLGEAVTQERAQPTWASKLPDLMRSVFREDKADVYVRAVLLNELLMLNELHIRAFDAPAQLTESFAELCEKPVSFWAPNDPEVAKSLTRIRDALRRLQPAFDKLIRESKATRLAERVALYRPLQVSGLVSMRPSGEPQVLPLPGTQPFGEYWIVRAREGGFVFEIAARTDSAGAIRWIKGVDGIAGQPLLSPTDRQDTAAVLRRYVKDATLGAPSPFPINAGSAP